MNAFCTSCGAAVTSQERSRKWLWWILAIVAAFLLGLWLGRGPAAKRRPPCPAAGTVETSPGRVIKGPGSPVKLGDPGSGDAPAVSGGGSSKVPHGSGTEGEGRDDGGKDPAHGKSPNGDMGEDEATPPSNGQGDLLRSDLRKYAEGKDGPDGTVRTPEGSSAPAVKSYSANDFTYDKTGLPRFPDAVTAVVSSVSYGPDGKTDSFKTGAGIVTSSSFDTVVDWYRSHLPAGWHDMTIGDIGQLSAQLSAQSLSNLLGGQSGTPAASAAASATAPPERLRLSLFSPPAGSTSKSSVMIVQHGDSPVEALLQARVGSSP